MSIGAGVFLGAVILLIFLWIVTKDDIEDSGESEWNKTINSLANAYIKVYDIKMPENSIKTEVQKEE